MVVIAVGGWMTFPESVRSTTTRNPSKQMNDREHNDRGPSDPRQNKQLFRVAYGYNAENSSNSSSDDDDESQPMARPYPYACASPCVFRARPESTLEKRVPRYDMYIRIYIYIV